MTDITWSNEQRKLAELTPWAHNPRQIRQAEAERLEESLLEFGQVHPICIEPDGQICDGHQRQAVWQMSEHFGPDYVVDVRVASRPLSERERQKLTVYLHRGATGSWNFDLMADTFDLDDLLTWGFEEHELGLADFEDDSNDDNYSRKIEAPTYEPSAEKPLIADLFDTSRTDELIQEIDASDLPDAEKKFLRIAAQRHTVLRFDRIADYYAHSSVEVQRLMEDSALVIIDFERAIELGYVKLTEEIADLYREEYGDG